MNALKKKKCCETWVEIIQMIVHHSLGCTGHIIPYWSEWNADARQKVDLQKKPSLE